MVVQGSGYTREAGAKAEHCNGDGALGQGAAVPGLHRGGSMAHDNGGLGAPPPPPPLLFPFYKAARQPKSLKGANFATIAKSCQGLHLQNNKI